MANVITSTNLLRNFFSCCCCCKQDENEGDTTATTLHQLSLNLNCCSSNNANYTVTDGTEDDSEEAPKKEDDKQGDEKGRFTKKHLLQHQTSCSIWQRLQPGKSLRSESTRGRELAAHSTNVHVAQTETKPLSDDTLLCPQAQSSISSGFGGL